MSGQRSETGPTNLAESVEYQEDAVVSRTLIKEESGMATLFAFDRGQELSEHTAPYDALVHILDGTAEITVLQEAHRVKAGEVLIMSAGQPHAVRAVERFKMLLTMLKTKSAPNS